MPAVLFIELINLLDLLRRMPVITMAARDMAMATGPARRRLQIRAPVALVLASVVSAIEPIDDPSVVTIQYCSS